MIWPVSVIIFFYQNNVKIVTVNSSFNIKHLNINIILCKCSLYTRRHKCIDKLHET